MRARLTSSRACLLGRASATYAQTVRTSTGCRAANAARRRKTRRNITSGNGKEIMHKLNYLLVSLAILTGCFWPTPRDGHAAALGRRSATLSLAPVQFPDDQHIIYQNERQVGAIYSPRNDIRSEEHTS